jgi:hypothetical protein
MAMARAPLETREATLNWYELELWAAVTFFVHSKAGASDIGPPCSAWNCCVLRAHNSRVVLGVVADDGATVRVSDPAVAPSGS